MEARSAFVAFRGKDGMLLFGRICDRSKIPASGKLGKPGTWSVMVCASRSIPSARCRRPAFRDFLAVLAGMSLDFYCCGKEKAGGSWLRVHIIRFSSFP